MSDELLIESLANAAEEHGIVLPEACLKTMAGAVSGLSEYRSYGCECSHDSEETAHEYKCGDKVAVRNADGKWNEAVFINFDPEDFFPFAAMIKGHISLEYFQKENIRPLEPANE